MAMRARAAQRTILARVVPVVAVGALALSAAACSCPPADQFDQIFLLNATTGAPANTTDAGLDTMSPTRTDAGDDASSFDPSDAARPVDDAGFSDGACGDSEASDGASPDAASYCPPSLDCTGAAGGCVPGGECRAACDCIRRRTGLYAEETIRSCTLLAGAGPPQVKIHFEVPNALCNSH
jgi:hypothetical protein